MSNFQRTRSKVWWGDSPPNIGSPVAQAANWNQNKSHDDQDWEPQLPHWIANDPAEQQEPKAQVNVVVPNIVVEQWPLRRGSPGSHKSQDSGFSDSDSSPPPSQYYPSPETVDSKSTNNKSSSSSDSNNNENITVKQAVDFQSTPRPVKDEDAVDQAAGNDPSSPVNTLRGRNRSSSVIQTPYDLQKYYEVHHDEEHMELLKDSPKTNVVKKIINQESSCTVTKNVNTHSITEKCSTKKTFVSSQIDNSNSKVIKVAKVKDLETSKQKSEESLEYIHLSDNNQIAINNQPRIRSPISNVLSENNNNRTSKKIEYRRSLSHELEVDNAKLTPKFERTRLNKSLNYEAQKLDQQILDIQDGYHSLSYIDEDGTQAENNVPQPEEVPRQGHRTIFAKNIMDSLHLKTPKRGGPKAKQRIAAKAEKAKGQTCSFRIFSSRREKPVAVSTHAGGVLEGSRVPSLGLPRFTEESQWVVVGYPEQEKLLQNYNERLISSESDQNLQAKQQDTKEVPKLSKVRKLSPPAQFQDSTKDNNVNDTKREKLKVEKLNFLDVQLNLACTSTPKMLAPHEYMNGLDSTPQSNIKNTKIRRINLLDNFNGVKASSDYHNDTEDIFRELSIDQTNLERLCDRKPEPVQYWLCDLVGSCESECMTTLQSKALGTEMKALVSASSATITGNIKKVQTHGQIIVYQYSDVIREIEHNGPSEEQICLLVANINEFVLAHSITLNTKPPGETPERWDKIKKSLQSYLQKLIDIGEDIKVEMNESRSDWEVVQKHLDSLVNIFLETTKAVLVQQLRTLVSIIEEPPSDMILKSTLTSIGHLAMLTGEHEGSIHEKCVRIMKGISELPFVDCGVPRALLTAIIESSKSSIKALSLRALATICVTGEAVKQFEEGGGIEILSDILSDRSNPEPQMREAITVLTQVTAPWLRGHYDLQQLHLYLEPIIKNITGILSRTDCCQLLLLCTACVVNLVRELELQDSPDLEIVAKSDIVDVIVRHRTVERLLEAVKKRGPNISVFLQEQSAALISSLARVPRCLRHLTSLGAVSVALVCFARAPLAPAPAPRATETRAQARLHLHTVEAISRLSIIPDVASQIVQLEGIPHLIRLVRMQRSQPSHPEGNPDQLLIFCLKALRTLHRCHPEAFSEYPKDVKEMILPHLMESLMLFSAKQESYV